MENETYPVVHDESEQCFRTPDGAVIGYTVERDRHIFDHTVVPPELRGKGVAGHLATAALEHARHNDWKIVPACSFIEKFIQRNPQYSDLVAGQ